MTDPRRPQAAVPAPRSQDRAGRERAARYLTIEELAAATTLSISTLRRLVKKGVIVGHQPGGPRHRIVFARDAIEQVVDAAQPSGAPPTNVPRSDGTPRPRRGPQPKWFQRS